MKPDRFYDGLARFDDARFGVRVIRLCKGQIENQPFYAFVGIEPQNLFYFHEHYKDGAYTDFRVFGRELLRGWGEEPPEDVAEYMRSKYNVHFEDEPEHVMDIARMSARMMSEGWIIPGLPQQDRFPPNASDARSAGKDFPVSSRRDAPS